MHDKKYVIPAVFVAAALFLASFSPNWGTAFADKSASDNSAQQQFEQKSNDGTMVKGKQTKGGVSAQGVHLLTGAWTDCSGTGKTATSQLSIASVPTNTVFFKWAFPSSTSTGIWPLCVVTNFTALQHSINNISKGWTVYSNPLDTNNVQNDMWRTYNIYNNNGQPLYIYSGDLLNVRTSACYGSLIACSYTGVATSLPFSAP